VAASSRSARGRPPGVEDAFVGQRTLLQHRLIARQQAEIGGIRMAKFRQNRLFIVVEGFQRFGLKPGLPVEFISGEMSRGRLPLTVCRVVCQKPAATGVSALAKGLPFNNRRPLSNRLWKLTKAISWARVTIPAGSSRRG
jgi:hypothetical protein